MRIRGRLARFTSWLAAWAILMMAVAPTLSHAAGPRATQAWLEICSAVGAKRIQAGAPAERPAGEPAAAHPFEHCPYCAMHADVLGMPPAASTLPVPGVAVRDVPVAFLSAPRTLHAWIAAPPRAPPRRG